MWAKFMDLRTRPLWKRFPGRYRAQVVETNDPLNMGRIKFRCPDMHDSNLLDSVCPWAVPSPELGGKAKRFVSPCIGDWVWITFERQHPYGPIWSGFADPMRRRLYVPPQITTPTAPSLDAVGNVLPPVIDYNVSYLPKDGRPMSHGWQDRYGNLDTHSAVGFFPFEHRKRPSSDEYDAVISSNFALQSSAPEVNNPDKKYMMRATKYGHITIQSDVGYYWLKNGPYGEFEGNVASDEAFEVRRYDYLQRLASEGTPSGKDQRKYMSTTRYGHMFEMRDVGYAQPGPVPSTSRSSEYGTASFLSTESVRDERWVKLRTKGGMLYQAIDVGNNPGTDTYVNRTVLDDVTNSPENEQVWAGKDARMIRNVTRHGIKFVLDDRGTHTSQAESQENPRCNGALLKGRRTGRSKGQPAEGKQTGFYWEFNENDLANHTHWGTPLGSTVELNDRFQYVMMAAGLGSDWPRPFRGLTENEFIRKHTAAVAESASHHIKLDADNEYIRFKTRAGQGNEPDLPIMPVFTGEHQGLEARDGTAGDGPWVELVDAERRGLWFSSKFGISVLRAKNGSNILQVLDDKQNQMLMLNLMPNGKINIYSAGDVNVISDTTVRLQSAGTIEMNAPKGIFMNGAGVKLGIADGKVATQTYFAAARFVGVADAASVAGKVGPFKGGTQNVREVTSVQRPTPPQLVEPTDRGKTYNGPFDECPIQEVEHPRQL
jgi:hypothetical protein